MCSNKIFGKSCKLLRSCGSHDRRSLQLFPNILLLRVSYSIRVIFIHFYSQLHATLSSHPLTSIVTPLIDIITAIDLHLFRWLLLSPSVFLWIVSSGARLITWIGNWTIKTRTIFSIVKSGNQTRHIFSTSKAHAATITTTTTTTTVINTNLPHFLSSEPSPQWSLPSHT